MSKKILIIGAGWYGCHIAKKMSERNYEVEIWEQSDTIFSKASGFNQNRLHQGFHYPRCFKTRQQSKRGFHLFKKEYPHLCQKLDFNLYAIPNENSLIDFQTYCDIMTASGLVFEVVTEVSPVSLNNIGGILDSNEEYICPKLARQYFQREIGDLVSYSKRIEIESIERIAKQYRFVIDCTWGASDLFPDARKYFETCVYHVYKSINFGRSALTVMDGEFFSIYPYGDSTYTVTHVDLIKVGQHDTMYEANEALQKVKDDANFVNENRLIMEQRIHEILPAFTRYFQYVRPEFSVKTKLRSSLDSRFVSVSQRGNVFGVLSGKIDTIFDADSIINKRITSDA